jgi:hypothetical protein
LLARAQIDDDCRSPVAMKRGHAIDDPVGAKVPGLVDVEIETDVQISADDHRIDAESIARHVDQPGRYARYDARDDYAVDIGKLLPVRGQERGQHCKPLVRHALALGRQAVRRRQLTRRGEEPERGVCVADFDGKEHSGPLATCTSQLR